MTQAAKAQEPSMEEILASIRRIIADDDGKPAAAADVAKAANGTTKPVATPPESKVVPKPAAPAPANPNNQDDIDALLAGLDADTQPEEVRAPAIAEAEDVFDLTEEMADDPVASDAATAEFAGSGTDDLEFAEKEPEAPKADAVAHHEADADFETGDDPMAAAMAAPEDEADTQTRPPQPSFLDNSPRFGHDRLDDIRMRSTSDFVQPDAQEPAFGSNFAERPLLSQSTLAAVDSAFSALSHTVLSANARTLEDLVREMLRPMLKTWLDDNLPGIVERIVRAEIERVARGR